MSDKESRSIEPSPWLLTVADLSQYLQVSVRSIWRLKSAGKLPKPVEIEGSVRWSAEVIRQWIDGGCPKR